MDSLKNAAANTAASLRSVNWKEGILAAPIILAYLVTGVLSVIIPVSQWTANKNAYYNAAGYYIEYENQQKEYEEQQNGNYNNYNNNNNNNGYYSYEECAWWNLSCRKTQYQYASYNQNNNNNNDNNQEIPGWYVMLGGQTEEMRRWQGELLVLRVHALIFVGFHHVHVHVFVLHALTTLLALPFKYT